MERLSTGGYNSAPPDVFTAWRRWNDHDLIEELDKEIRQANIDGVAVVLTLWHLYPPYSSGYPSSAPILTPQHKAPTSVDTNSPYGWFILWLLARYRYGAPVNGVKGTYGPTDGPHEGAQLGNPYGAYIWALEPVNEPNLNMWTQTTSPYRRDVHLKAAGMMKTAHFWSGKVATWTSPPQAVPTYI